MGYIAHDAAIAVCPDYRNGKQAIEALRDQMPEWIRPLCVGPVKGINGYDSFAFLPDGSKEGWGDSDEAEQWRQQFVDLATEHGDVVLIRFGGDAGADLGTTILFSSDTRFSDG